MPQLCPPWGSEGPPKFAVLPTLVRQETPALLEAVQPLLAPARPALYLEHLRWLALKGRLQLLSLALQPAWRLPPSLPLPPQFLGAAWEGSRRRG